MAESNSSASATGGGVSMLGLLGVILVVLKLFGLTEVSTWSWWLVLAPFWAGLAIFLVIFIIAGLFALAFALWGK